MPTDYYVKEADSVFGPATADQLRQMAATGRIRPDSLIATSPNGPWRAASKARSLTFKTVRPIDELPPSTMPPPLPPIIVTPAPTVEETLYRPAERSIRTVELTGKRWKAFILIGSLISIGGVVGIIIAVGSTSASGSRETDTTVFAVSILALLIGLVTYLIGRIGKFWYHE